MSPETQRPAPNRLAWLKGWGAEKMLQYLAQTAEDAMGLDYELNKIRAPKLEKDP